MHKLTKDLFCSREQSVKTDSLAGLNMAVLLSYQGNIPIHDLQNEVNKFKQTNQIEFVDWCPTGFKISINTDIPMAHPESGIANSDRRVTMIANNTNIKDAWVRLFSKYDLLLKRKAFVFWYLQEGLEESEFEKSRDSLAFLINQYRALCKTDDVRTSTVMSDYGLPTKE